MQLSLVILAAGMGSRYGGLKQLDGVGPGGETLLDYAVHDAVRAGFTRVVFIIRQAFEAEFRAQVGARYAGVIQVDYVFQELDALPAGFTAPAERTKPWGTGHAVWCARSAIVGPFAVVNADDFYGRDSYVQLARFLRATGGGGRPEVALVGFTLANTLSENGAVSRGVCAVRDDGLLRGIVEHTGIRREDVGSGRTFTGDEIVSMNCWAFTPAIFAGLERQFAEFLRNRAAEPKAEFYLPAAISELIATGAVDVQVLPTQASWFGVTYREDKPGVEAAIGRLIAAGEYPATLNSGISS
ncbi:MAG TPA: sugar phosphate nucleotidyltransferase [Opitutus sp.]|nr:sugar phosphate nucleotidyltransferase [Opitutus sp.]